jgi:hypothetical protein
MPWLINNYALKGGGGEVGPDEKGLDNCARFW